MVTQSLWRTVCVKECPKGDESVLQCKPNKYVTSCQENNSADNEEAVEIYSTFPIRSSVCMADS